VKAYQRLTGIPPLPPLWSYGAWMARMSYFSAKEALEVADFRSGFQASLSGAMMYRGFTPFPVS
jgi:alpha-glucosidase (family GH31 glycosyl hydrolase)